MLPRDRVLEALLALSDSGSGRSHDALIERALRALLALVPCEGVTALTSRRRKLRRTALVRGPGEPQFTECPRPANESTRALLRSGQPVQSLDLAADPRFGEMDGCPGVEAGPALYVRLRPREQGAGHLAIHRRRGGTAFTSEEAATLMLIAAWAAAALDHRRASETLERLAVTDDLTQVYNYRFLKTALRREIKRAGRFAQDLALVMIDVDNLKLYNDRNGHLRGSFLLKEIAARIAGEVRSFDLVAKYGGDEFTIILPQTGREGAVVVAERIRAAVAQHAFPLAPAGTITISLGVAMFPEDAGDGTALIQAADRALYLAKQRGRNRVEALWPLAA